MKFDSRHFKLTLCAVLLSASTMACSAPGAPTDGAAPGASPSTFNPMPGVSPIAMTVTEKKAGEGEQLDGAEAFLFKVQLWEDKIDGKPMGRGEVDMLVVPETGQLPGLVQAAEGMKVGGVKDLVMTAKDLFGQMDGVRMDPTRKMYLRVTAQEVYPKEEFKIETVKEGSGEKVAAEGDIVMVDYTGHLENKDGKVFDSSKKEGRTPFAVELGKGGVIAGWEKGLLGAKKGETRTLSIPHYLAYGPNGKGDIPGKARLYFEIEVVDFVAPGELETKIVTEGKGEAIKAGDKGEFHYTGWLDGFESDKKFDSSLDRNQPLPLTLGQGQVIQGWDEGLVGMKPGEVRRLTIPYNMAYGPQGRPPTIPPYATLYFEVKYVGPAK